MPLSCGLAWMETQGQKDKPCPLSPSHGVEAYFLLPLNIRTPSSMAIGLWICISGPRKLLSLVSLTGGYTIGFPNAEALGLALSHTTDTLRLVACRQSIMGPLCLHDTSPLTDPLGSICVVSSD